VATFDILQPSQMSSTRVSVWATKPALIVIVSRYISSSTVSTELFSDFVRPGHSGVVFTVNTAKLRRLTMAVADFHVLDGNRR
jgi:hypothetical protein